MLFLFLERKKLNIMEFVLSVNFSLEAELALDYLVDMYDVYLKRKLGLTDGVLMPIWHSRLTDENQQYYFELDALCVDQVLQQRLAQEAGLHRVIMPTGEKQLRTTTFIKVFMNDDDVALALDDTLKVRRSYDIHQRKRVVDVRLDGSYREWEDDAMVAQGDLDVFYEGLS